MAWFTAPSEAGERRKPVPTRTVDVGTTTGGRYDSFPRHHEGMGRRWSDRRFRVVLVLAVLMALVAARSRWPRHDRHVSSSSLAHEALERTDFELDLQD